MPEMRTSFHPEFDPLVSEFHESFKKELNDQLFLKGNATGIKSFEKQGFFFLVGLIPLELEQRDNRMYAKIYFGMQPSFTFDSWIYWQAKDSSSKVPIAELHKTEVSSDTIDFHWDVDRFPLETVSMCLKPAKKTKTPKNKLAFDVAYYHTALPDIELNFKAPADQLQSIGSRIHQSILKFNEELPIDKKFQAFSEPVLEEDQVQFILDIGLANSIRTVNQLLSAISNSVGEEITLVEVK